MQPFVDTVKNQFFETFSQPIRLIDIISEWRGTLYVICEKGNFSEAILQDLLTYVQIVSTIDSSQRSLFERQIWSLQGLNEPELSINLKAMIHFANKFYEHEFDVFPENEFIELFRLWMQQFDKSWLDIQIATRKSLNKMISRTNTNQFYGFYQNHIMGADITSITRFYEALLIFNQTAHCLPWYAYSYFLDQYCLDTISTHTPLPQAVALFCRSLQRKYDPLQSNCLFASTNLSEAISYDILFSELDKIPSAYLTINFLKRIVTDYIQHITMETRPSLQQAIEVYLQTQVEPFLQTVLGHFFLRESITHVRIEDLQLFMRCIKQYDLSPTMINGIFNVFQKNVQLKSTTALPQLAALTQKIHASKFAETHLLKEFFLKLESYTEEELCQLRCFLDRVDAHDLPPDVIDALFYYFKVSSIDQFNEAIAVMQLAIQLASNNSLFVNFFSSEGYSEIKKSVFIRYVYYGLLDFLGEEFRQKCLMMYESLYLGSISASSFRTNGLSGRENLNGGYNTLCNTIQEICDILRKPVNSSQFRANPYVFCVPKHQAFFHTHQNHYKSLFFSTSSSRKRQAQQFFQSLKNVRAHEKNPQYYYTEIFEKIFTAQKAIMIDDHKLNQSRWFFQINNKGYSRLYHISNQILIEMLMHYNQAVVHGSIKPEDYSAFKEKLKKQSLIQVEYLIKGLPKTHDLQQGLIHVVKNDVDSLRVLFAKNHQIPRHLSHLMSSVRAFLAFDESLQYENSITSNCH